MPVSMDDAEFARLLAALPRQRGALLPALLLMQRTYGYVSDDAVQAIAAHLRLTVNVVEGVATATRTFAAGRLGATLSASAPV